MDCCVWITVFYDKDIFTYIEDKDRPIVYVIAVPIYTSIQRKIASQKAWLSIEKCIEKSEFEYQAKDLDKTCRMIVVRKKKSTSKSSRQTTFDV